MYQCHSIRDNQVTEEIFEYILIQMNEIIELRQQQSYMNSYFDLIERNQLEILLNSNLFNILFSIHFSFKSKTHSK